MEGGGGGLALRVFAESGVVAEETERLSGGGRLDVRFRREKETRVPKVSILQEKRERERERRKLV